MDMATEDFGGLPQDKPSVARMYDYFLGGAHNFEVDRNAAEQALKIYPDGARVMQANRAFLRRAVTFLVAQGLSQFLDIGSGIPTVGNVHEVAQRANPATHVVYVDIDPVAVAHGKTILTDTHNATVVQADARLPGYILTHPEVLRLLDFRAPIVVLLVALLHFIIDDEDAYDLVHHLRDALAPGSYIVITHVTDENVPRDVVEQSEKLYARSTTPATFRTRARIAKFFDGFDLVDPGLVYVPLWHPEEPNDLFLDQPERSVILAGVGRKPKCS